MPTGKEFYSFPYAKISVKLRSGSGKEFYSFPVANRGAGRNGNSFPLGHTTELYKNGNSCPGGLKFLPGW